MINWDELKHIHVIRKLESIIAHWFKADVFFIDDRGQVKNLDFKERMQDFKSPLFKNLLGVRKKEALHEHFAVWAEEANQSDKKSFIRKGFLGQESVIISKITNGGEFYGLVVAYAFFEPGFSVAQISASQELRENLIELKQVTEGELKYLGELVDLVGEEIVTYHLEISKRQERIEALSNELGSRYSYGNMIGKAKSIQSLYSVLEKIKTSDSTVLVNGENGTGKELIAKAIHYNSPRKDSPFVTVNCSAFNENLLDSELFGHVRGSFTGAVRDKKGLFEVAHRGTLFLDEIGDMSPTMQVKLLRVLQEGTLISVGSTDQKKVDVRVLAATNKDLKAMIAAGTFREDLYYRINVINIVVPPLRERKEDIPLLVEHFLSRGCKEKSIPLKQVSKRALEKLFDFNWPGNIRELENEVERLVVLSGEEKLISPELLSPKIRDFGETPKIQGVRVSGKLRDALEELEITMIREGLKRTGWNKSRLAKELGISRAGLIMKVEKYGLDKRKLARMQAAALAAAAAGGSVPGGGESSGNNGEGEVA